MSVSRIPRAPRSQSSSISRWAPARGTIARTATQPSRCSGETVGLSMPGVSATAAADVLARGCRSPSSRSSGRPGRPRAGAGRPRARPGPSPPRVISTASDSRIDLAEDLQARPARSVLPVSTTSAITSATPSWTLVSTAPSSRITVASMPALVEELPHDADVRRGDPGALRAGRGRRNGRPGRRSGSVLRPKPSAEHLLGLGAGVEQQVAAGDADVEGALADVQRDVARAQVEELHAVLGVDERELLGVLALAVAGLAQHLGGGLRQRALVGDRDPQQVGGRVVRASSASSQVGVDVVEGQAAWRASAPGRGRAAG